MKVSYFETRAAFRRWLQKHHSRHVELRVGFRTVASGEKSITYSEALEEALCFGWIDGVRKRLDSTRYTIRFTPRKRGSYWSAVNTRRARALMRLGRIKPAGRRAFEARDAGKTAKYSFERRNAALDKDSRRRFMARRRAWAFFQAQPPGYRHIATFWVISAKQEETRRRRMKRLIEDSHAGRRLPMLTSPSRRRPARASR
jgi:uncharacterized protein YdeI (YjbR/CyaY-like superfamily)